VHVLTLVGVTRVVWFQLVGKAMNGYSVASRALLHFNVDLTGIFVLIFSSFLVLQSYGACGGSPSIKFLISYNGRL